MELDEMSKERMLEVARQGTRPQMLDLAHALGVRGVRDKAKPAIQEALLDALGSMETSEDRARAAMQADQGVPKDPTPAADAPIVAPPEPPVDVYACLTDEQRTKLKGASLETIDRVLSDPGLVPEWRAAFEAERVVRLRQIEACRRVPYRVANTCPPGQPQGVHYIAPGTAYKTWLATGTFVFEDTHDFQALRDQGIVLERCDGQVVTTINQCGIPVSVLQRVVPDGDAPRPDAAAE